MNTDADFAAQCFDIAYRRACREKDAEIARLTTVIRTAATEIEAGCKAWALRTLHDALGGTP